MDGRGQVWHCLTIFLCDTCKANTYLLFFFPFHSLFPNTRGSCRAAYNYAVSRFRGNNYNTSISRYAIRNELVKLKYTHPRWKFLVEKDIPAKIIEEAVFEATENAREVKKKRNDGGKDILHFKRKKRRRVETITITAECIRWVGDKLVFYPRIGRHVYNDHGPIAIEKKRTNNCWPDKDNMFTCKVSRDHRTNDFFFIWVHGRNKKMSRENQAEFTTWYEFLFLTFFLGVVVLF